MTIDEVRDMYIDIARQATAGRRQIRWKLPSARILISAMKWLTHRNMADLKSATCDGTMADAK